MRVEYVSKLEEKNGIIKSTILKHKETIKAGEVAKVVKVVTLRRF